MEAASSKGTSGVAWVKGAELAPAGSAWPHEDARAGEACASQSPAFSGRGTATDGASGAPFGFFVAGASLAGRYEHQVSANKTIIKKGIKHLQVVAGGLKQPPAVLKA